MGIKELLEVLNAVEALSVDAIEHLKDGVGLDDISVLTENITLIKDAVDGVGEVPGELKDLDAEEIKQLLLKGTDMVFNILAALKEEK